MNLPQPHDNKEKKEKKGAGAPWLLGAQTGAGSSGGFSYQLGTLADLIARSTGISTIAATKFGVAALALSAGTIAMAVSLFIHTRSSSPASLPAGQFIFEQHDSARFSEARSDASVQTQPSALDYFSQANPISSQLADVGEPNPAPTSPPWREVIKQSLPKAAAKSKSAVTTATPRMKVAKVAPGSASGGAQSILKAVPSLSGKVGNGFQEIYRRTAGAFAASRASLSKRAMHSVIQKDAGAMSQAMTASRISRQAAVMSQSEGAAADASSAFDANNAHAHSLGMTTNGNGSISDRANSVMETNQLGAIAPPPPVQNTQNKTPYQGLIVAGMAALMMGQMLVMAAGQMVSSAQSNPAAAPNLLAQAKALAVAAMGAGGGAGAIGGALSGQYNQGSQAIPYIVGGAVIAAQAAIVLVRAEAAGQQAEEGVGNAANEGASQAAQALQPPQMPPMGGDNSGNNKNEQPKPKPPPRPDVNKIDGPPFTGNISPP